MRHDMKALTIWQPWASLIMVGAKPYEFRLRSYFDYAGHPKPGDRIVIHAGARPMKVKEIADLLNKLGSFETDPTGLKFEIAYPFLERIWKMPRKQMQTLPLGCGLGTVVMGEPVNAEAIFGGVPQDSDRCEFNWAWPLTNIQPFDAPIPCRGLQGFWTWPANLSFDQGGRASQAFAVSAHG